MIRTLSIALGICIVLLAASIMWGVHEYGNAKTAVANTRADVTRAQVAAEQQARQAQRQADANAMQHYKDLVAQAQAEVRATRAKADAINKHADQLHAQIQRMKTHAKPADCINQSLPAALKRLHAGDQGSPR